MAEFRREGGGVADGGLEVEIEAVDGGGAEGSEGVRVGLGGPECGPDFVRGRDGGGGAGETAFAVGGAADGEEDCGAVGLLATCYVRSGRRVEAFVSGLDRRREVVRGRTG